MGQPVSGAWARKYQLDVPYADARKWGTGINPVHAVYGDPGRPQHPKLDNSGMDHIPAGEAVPQGFMSGPPDWGYQPEDIAGLDVTANEYDAVTGIPYNVDGRPEWGQDAVVLRDNIPGYTSRPWGLSRQFYNRLRGVRIDPGTQGYKFSSATPTETVNEGWINKPASGMEEGEIPDSLPSDDAQVFVQTSRVQRYKKLVNDRALLRGTDEERTPVDSRVAPMKLKVYSGEERHYDMFPYQMDDVPRPFRYRTAGVGPLGYLRSNDQMERTAVQRTPPPDPSMGTPDSQLSESDFGYAEEDQGYY